MTLQFFTLLICSLLWIGIAITLIYSWLKHTPFYPSNPNKINKVLEELNLDYKDKNFLDLGSGDGRVVIWAARKGMIAEGIELNPYLTLLSRLKIILYRLNSRAKIINANFNNHNFSKYNIMYSYIYKEYLNIIEDRLFSEMKSGSIIISKHFTLNSHEPDLKIAEFNVYLVK